IVENRVKPRTIDDRLASNTLPQPAGVMATAAQLYAGIISGMIIPQQSNEVESLVSQGKTNGWSVAGTYYYVLAASQKQELFSSAKMAPPVSGIPAQNNHSSVSDYMTGL